MENLYYFINTYLEQVYIPVLKITDIIDIIIMSILIYYIMKIIKNTRAWALLKGIGAIFLLTLLAIVFKLNTILWLFNKTVKTGVIALVIIFQPELRRILEQIGRRNLLTKWFAFEDLKTERLTDKTVGAIVFAVFELAKVKTGALLVIEKNIVLAEYEKTGISIDAHISSQLIINIFENKSPLHDGAMIIRENRIVAATCYLPLSGNMNIGKEFGTRHRAAVGISEVSDSATIIVSEETGGVSLAIGGTLIKNIDESYLQKKLEKMQTKAIIEDKKIKFWKGSSGNEITKQ